MTTAKEVLNGPAVPPSFLESVFSKFKSPVAPPDPDAQLHNREPLKPETSDLPSPAAAQAPATSDDHRCKFSFSDGRQCRMPRAAHHDYLCAHHASKEAAESGAISFPELEALCADLTSATNINRAVTHVFLLLAQGRVTERQALCFASLARLLLRTIPDLHDEWIGVLGTRAYAEKLKAKLLASPPAPPEETAKPRPQNAVPAANPAGLQPRRDQPLPITPRLVPFPFPSSAPALSRPSVHIQRLHPWRRQTRVHLPSSPRSARPPAVRQSRGHHFPLIPSYPKTLSGRIVRPQPPR